MTFVTLFYYYCIGGSSNKTHSNFCFFFFGFKNENILTKFLNEFYILHTKKKRILKTNRILNIDIIFLNFFFEFLFRCMPSPSRSLYFAHDLTAIWHFLTGTTSYKAWSCRYFSSIRNITGFVGHP